MIIYVQIGKDDAHSWTGTAQAFLTAAHVLSLWSNILSGVCFGGVIGLFVYKYYTNRDAG